MVPKKSFIQFPIISPEIVGRNITDNIINKMENFLINFKLF